MNEKSSITGKTWLEYNPPNNLVELLVERYRIPYIIAAILLNRGIVEEKAKHFLDPKLRNFMLDPYLIKDMDKAIPLIEQILLNKQAICILGDYDVDGMTSTAIIYKYLVAAGGSVSYYIPNRFEEGYGGSLNSIKQIIARKVNLVIMVDNGSSSIDEVELLRSSNIEVIILDHHVTPPLMPNANALVNPNRLDDTSKLNYLCSAGLAFLFLVALNRSLTNTNYFVNNNLAVPDLLKFLDLVALATVCDMVPLVDLNRAYVVQGLKVLTSSNNLGISTLLNVLDFNNKIDAETLGFTIGPVINAASRMGKEELALKLLITNDRSEAVTLASTMKQINIDRQGLEDQIINHAVTEITNLNLNNDSNFIFLGSEEWSQGLVGIVAGRIKEIHHKPTCIYAINSTTNIATASGRSIPNLDLGSVVIAAKQANLLTKGGGHSQAVGFSFDLAKKTEIFNFFNERIKQQIIKKDVSPNLQIDYNIALSAVNTKLIENLTTLQPFGINFSEPLFKITNIFINNIRQIGKHKNHLSFEVFDGSRKIKGIAFKAIPSKLGEFLLNAPKAPVDIVVAIKGNFYQGNTYPNLILIDIAK